MKKLIPFILLLLSMGVYAQVDHVEPAFWWIGMKSPHLQILVHGADISKTDVSLHYPGVQLIAVHKVSSPNYLFLDLLIDSKTSKPGKFTIDFKERGKTFETCIYE